MVTLKASHFGKDGLVSVFPNWISNGHWAIRRQLISNSGLFTAETTIRAAFPRVLTIRVEDTDSKFDRVMPTGELSPFTVTRWTYEGDNKRYALATHNAQHTYFDRAYLDLLDFADNSKLYLKDAFSAATDSPDAEDRTFVLMPAIIDKTGRHLEPLISLVHLLDLQADEPAEVSR